MNELKQMKKLKQSLNELTPKSVIGNRDIVDEQQNVAFTIHTQCTVESWEPPNFKWKKTFSYYLQLI